MKQTSKGPVRLAFKGKGKVVEAKSMKTGAMHTPEEFSAERKKWANPMMNERETRAMRVKEFETTHGEKEI